ncbi:cupin domain-containing protein [Brevibacillus choshinensis]|uniref:cupin domain-containing protein n=1 Tax=Brevibacillus choshinensis TaxID=54911 RepID=UPI002E1AE546|nr:cupin domain-containing protein [Brevibacillus choshinensis]MED4750635.1 cupin domain-containing protein [Brevibacillus choshinensis]
MIVINANEVNQDNRPDDARLKTLFPKGIIDGGKVMFGTVVIPPKARVPMKGQGAHDQDEYSYIMRGTIQTESGGKAYTVSAGEATLIPAGEEHWAYNAGDEDCEIVWVLVER